MVTYTTQLKGRDPDRIRLKRDEALEMAAKGFQFAEFDEAGERFRLSIPYRTAQNLDRGTLTFMQG